MHMDRLRLRPVARNKGISRSRIVHRTGDRRSSRAHRGTVQAYEALRPSLPVHAIHEHRYLDGDEEAVPGWFFC